MPQHPGKSFVGGLVRNPRLQGIFDDGEQEQQQRPGLGAALGQVFGGVDDPNLSPEQNAAAGRAGRLQAGLATVLASQSRGLGPSLAAGALVGQQAGAEQRQALVEKSAARKRLAAISQALGTGVLDRSDVSKALRIAVRAGDSGTAGMMIDLMKTLPETDPNEVGMKLVTVNGESFLTDGEANLFDPFTKEPITEPPEEALEGTSSFREEVFNAETGVMETWHIRLDANDNIIGRQLVGQSKAPEALEQGDLAGMANQLRNDFGILKTLIDQHGVPNRLQTAMPNEVKPFVGGDWIQQYESVSGKINITASRMMFGARVSDDERKALSEVLTPRAGDSEATVNQKIAGLELLISDFERGQGIYDLDGDAGPERYIGDIPGSELSSFSF